MICFISGYQCAHWPGGEDPWIPGFYLLLPFPICSMRSLGMVPFQFLANLKYLTLYVKIHHSSNNVLGRGRKKKRKEKREGGSQIRKRNTPDKSWDLQYIEYSLIGNWEIDKITCAQIFRSLSRPRTNKTHSRAMARCNLTWQDGHSGQRGLQTGRASECSGQQYAEN